MNRVLQWAGILALAYAAYFDWKHRYFVAGILKDVTIVCVYARLGWFYDENLD